MQKVILITGSTDGIGLQTAQMLVSMGHHVLMHGRSQAKLDSAIQSVSAISDDVNIEGYVADLSKMREVESLAREVAKRHDKLDVLINNAGVFRVPDYLSEDGLDVRFAVNTIAPYLLTKKLLPLLGTSGRVINLSSAAQSRVNLEALAGRAQLSDSSAYAQSKLALTMWSRAIALSYKQEGPSIIAVNPGSMLGSKMVKEAFGVAGRDLQIGAEILTSVAISDEFENASGQYFDNDIGQLASAHDDAYDSEKSQEIVSTIETILAGLKS